MGRCCRQGLGLAFSHACEEWIRETQRAGVNMADIDATRLEILKPEQMGEADRLTIEQGLPGYQLMEVAGQAVTDGAMALLEQVTGSSASGMVCILCGPGNNGGDGFVAARLLEEEGWSVILGCSAELDDLSGDARLAALDWGDEIYPLSPRLWQDADMVIDAMFGAGLDRPLKGEFADLVDALNASGLPVLAVDLPSGVEGASGFVRGAAVRADHTVTFFRSKPGHLLYPGKALCGQIRCMDIGIEPDVLDEVGCAGFINHPDMWMDSWPEALKPLDVIVPGRLADHKFHRGHCLILSGDEVHSGAARLAARAALRSGAGLVTLAPPANAASVVAGHVTAIMVAPVQDRASLQAVLNERQYDVLLAGPALGRGEQSRELFQVCLEQDAGLVLDADALSMLASDLEVGRLSFEDLRGLPAATSDTLVMTPHEGEFARLFPDLSHRVREDKGMSKIDCAIVAAQRFGAIIVLKGGDSVIAHPNGRAVIHSKGVPYLATAGSGDVLAGIVAGLMAQGMPGLEAACAAVWLHSKAGILCGPGLIAEDLPDALPAIFHEMFAQPPIAVMAEG